MFNVGPGELIIVALVLLIAVGPEQLPGVIRRAGTVIGQAKSMTEGLRSDFMSGMDEIERATDPNAWAASAGPSNVKPAAAKAAEPEDDVEPEQEAGPEQDAGPEAESEVASEPAQDSEPELATEHKSDPAQALDNLTGPDAVSNGTDVASNGTDGVNNGTEPQASTEPEGSA